VCSWPPRSRRPQVIVPSFLVMVTSVISSRAMRLRSRCGVPGSFQIAGKSVTSHWIRVFWRSVSSVAALLALSPPLQGLRMYLALTLCKPRLNDTAPLAPAPS
jgi:hypothetical protein